MYILVIGGGKIGYHLVRNLLSEGHEVGVIEKDLRVCDAIADQYNVMVINGDGTYPSLLREAGAERADCVVAVAGRDQDNLVCCQLSKHVFGVKRTIARVNDPRNDELFHLLGVNALISVTALVSNLIDREIAPQDMITLLTLKHGHLVMVEASLKGDSPAVGKALSDLQLPADSILVSVLRGDLVVVPTGTTVLESGDDLVAITTSGHEVELRKALVG